MQNNFTEKDEAVFAASFIPSSLAQSAGIIRVDSRTGAELLGRKPKASEDLNGLGFPYIYPGDNHVRAWRLRLDKPFEDANGKVTAKYLSSIQTKPKIYFPPNTTQEMLENVSLEIVIGEGEKKGLSKHRCATNDLTTQPKFLSLALSGVWNFRESFQNKKRDIGDFNSINWTGRKITILFDADISEKPQVAQAEKELAKTLKSRGAKVFICRMPKVENFKGIDDLLHYWSADGVEVAIKRFYELLETSKEFEADRIYLLNDLRLSFSYGSTDKTNVLLYRNDSLLHQDLFKIAEADKREKFLKAVELTKDEKREINHALMSLVPVRQQQQEIKSTETFCTSFQVLKDGRIIEQIRGGFAVYHPETNEHSIVEFVTDEDGITYEYDRDELLNQAEGGINLADALQEYGDEETLDKDIELFIQKYADISDLNRKITAKYIRFTYLFDKVYELPYITATGEGGNGKTRLGELVALTSRRGLTLVNPSAASLFRIIDKYQPTLFLDELNLTETGEDTLAILQVLNSGIKKMTGFVPRQEKNGDGNFQTRLYKTFSPKIIGSLKKTNSQPFNSRCVQIEMEATKRNDIPFRTTSQMLADAQTLRNKLILFRLRNFSKDFEAKLELAETEMKGAELKARTIQVNTPLMALCEKKVRTDFLKLLKEADKVRAQDKLDSLDGEIIQAIHSVIFPTDEDGTERIIMFEHGKLCQDLRVEQILDCINADRKEKDKIDARRMGQLLKRLKIQTEKIKSRASAHRDKKALIFDCEVFKKLFESFSLPCFPENTCPQCHQDTKANNSDSLRGDKQNLTVNHLSPNKLNDCNIYKRGDIGDKQNQEISERENILINHQNGSGNGVTIEL